MATMPGREKQLARAVASLINQVDKIRVVCNNMSQPPECLGHPKIEPIVGLPDMTDNGKFYALDNLKGREYYFTVDDDIIYPRDYVARTIRNIQKYHSIITYHGRRLRAPGVEYYKGHDFFHCAHGNDIAQFIDVCGTGVTAFDTAMFKPEGLAGSEFQRMSDVIFSHAAANANRTIVLGVKRGGWIEPQHVTESIFNTESKTKQTKHIQLCNEIIKLKLRH